MQADRNAIINQMELRSVDLLPAGFIHLSFVLCKSLQCAAYIHSSIPTPLLCGEPV